MPGCSIIVKRGDLERYELLFKTFGQRVTVLWDRRKNQRRQATDVLSSGDRRRAERRGLPGTSWKSLGFVVVER
ncbi:MAG: hypothetical protein HOP16_14285 [Acidobacteria bacterium]|nr:hypothetical protein [Acidobacteriota bacterium]